MSEPAPEDIFGTLRGGEGSVATDAPRASAPAPAVSGDPFEAALRGCYYDAHGGRYFYPRQPGPGWVVVAEASLKRHLSLRGTRKDELPAALCFVQTRRAVDFAGPVAGHACGPLDYGGRIILVTEQAKPVAPAPGEWPTLRKFLRELLAPPGDADAGKLQFEHFLGWLHVALLSLHAREYRPGQCLILAGERDGGKSLAVRMIARLFGGRVAHPYSSMTGATDFNSEAFGSELLVVDDEVASADIRARRALGTNIKSWLYADSVRCHPKGRPAVSLRPWWRLVIACNSEPEALAVLPPLDASLADKLLAFRCGRASLPPTETQEDRAALLSRLDGELPALAHYAMRRHRIADNLRCRRNGVASYISPAIEDALHELSPEAKLAALIEQTIGQEADAGSGVATWEGTATELEREMKASHGGRYAAEVSRVLPHPNTCGNYLARLASKMPEGVAKAGHAHGHVTRWKITPARLAVGERGSKFFTS